MNFSSITGKNWFSKKFDSSDLTKYVENYSLPEITAKLLSIRKEKISSIPNFLNPKIKNLLPNPLVLKDMEKATKKTYEILLKKETIGIFGDYDVDGASSTALLARYFSSLNQKFVTYIPDRQKEGYGPSKKGFDNLIKKGVKLIFTVDCGTSSFEQIDLANKKKVDTIVLDHHQSDITLPKAYALVNPNRYDDESNLNYLCAAGVCFVFLVALNKLLRDKDWFKKNNKEEPNILNFLDLVSLGTVCDVVPLVDLNRALVKQGLKIIKNRKNLGLKTLYDICKIQSYPSTYDLGFKIGPRLNAGGRLGKSSHGAELLISEDPQKVYQIATDLEKSNLERQSIQSLLSQEVNNEVKKHHNYPVLVLSGNNWHEGVIGIVASKIKDKFNKPTILISLKNGVGKGSARSVIGFDIGSQIIHAVQNNILDFGGGHKMAGGFTIKENNIPRFRDLLIKNYEKNSNKLKNNADLYFDTIISPSALNESFMNQINTLSPFGSGNNEPRFIIENIKVLSSKVIAKSHIRSVLLGSDGTKFIGFSWNSINTLLESYLMNANKKKINLIGKMKLNEWKGEKKIEFIIEDISL